MLNNKNIADGSTALFMMYPVFRRILFEAFDKHSVKITRTQQTILITMSCSDTLSMSDLARRINTSNEQATRAVTQLVAMGYIDRAQNEQNHRIVNINLTDKAIAYVSEVSSIAENLLYEYIGNESARKLNTGFSAIAKSFASSN